MLLTFKQAGWYLNLTAWVMKNISEQKKIKIMNWHFVENRSEIMQHVLKMLYICLVPKYCI
jgi:hypothetical protein